jgi:hypothetical protein
LRAYIAGAPATATAADITREVGDLAWELGFPRPSYQRVRLLLGERRRPRGAVSTPAPGLLHYVSKTIDFLYQYPGPGLENWYLRYIGVK